MCFLQYFFIIDDNNSNHGMSFDSSSCSILTLTTIKQLNIMVKRKATVDCNEFFDHCVDNINTVNNINTIVIPVCSGIEALFDALLVDPVVIDSICHRKTRMFFLALMPSSMRHRMHSISTASMMMIIENFSKFENIVPET